MLRDRIVCGISDDGMQRRLLAETDLDYTKAVEVAINMEAAAKSVQELRGQSVNQSSFVPSVPMHTTSTTTAARSGALDRRVEGGVGPTCFRCGLRGYTVAKCKLDKKLVCHGCGKRGHIQRACKTRPRSRSPKSGRGRVRTVARVEEEEGVEDDHRHNSSQPLCHVDSSQVSPSPPIQVRVQLDECVVAMEVDIGAAVSLMSEATFMHL